MKIDLLDAHDRLLHFKKQSDDISTYCQKIIDQNPFPGTKYFYIFAHARTHDNGIDKRMIWQPRLCKPEPQENSMLFRVKPNSDGVEVVWIIPDKALWKQYKKGNVTENETILKSIHDFRYHKNRLAAPHPEDYSDKEIEWIYTELSVNARARQGKLKVLHESSSEG
jgi:hypothetical protein